MQNELIGWLSTICFSLCAMPQVIRCFKNKHGRDIPWDLTIIWTLGEIFAIIYVLPIRDYPLLCNYFLNLLLLSIIIYYKVKDDVRRKGS